MLRRPAGMAVAALGLAASLALTGCGSSGGSGNSGGSGSGGTASAKAGAASGAPLVIWADDQRVAVLKPFAAQFEKKYGVKVALRSFTFANLQADFVTAAQHGTGPDIVVLANDAIGNLVQNGAIEPVQLSSAQQAAFQPTAINAMKYDGQIYGVPYDIENIGLIRNTKLAPSAPSSIDQLVSEGAKLKQEGKVTNPLCLQSGTAGDAYHIFPFYTSGGGQLFGTTSNGDLDPKQVLIASKSSIAAWSKLRSIGMKGSGALTTAITPDNAISAFAAGKCPFLVSGPWATQAIQQAKVKYAISNIPSWSGGQPARPFLGVSAFFVSGKGKNPTLAQTFVSTFVTQPAVQEALFKAGDRPEALTAALNASVQADPDMQAWLNAGKDGVPMPDIPAMNEVWTPMGALEASVIAGANPATAAPAAAKSIEKAIASS